MNYSIISLFLLFTFLSTKGQPYWINEPPVAENSTFCYRIAWGEGETKEEAWMAAISHVLYETALSLGLAVSIDEINRTIREKDLLEIEEQMNIPINKVCEYNEPLITKTGYRVYVLCQVAKQGNIKPEFVSFKYCRKKEKKEKSIFGWNRKTK